MSAPDGGAVDPVLSNHIIYLFVLFALFKEKYPPSLVLACVSNVIDVEPIVLVLSNHIKYLN